MKKPIVFFDGSCSMCTKEINFYKKLRDANKIEWFDISKSDELLLTYNITFYEAMADLHVIDSLGQKKIGAYAFIIIWQQFYQFRFIANSLEALKLVPLLQYVYRKFAKWRLKNMKCEAKSAAQLEK